MFCYQIYLEPRQLEFFLLSFAATLIFPLLIMDIEQSKIKGALFFKETPKAMGLVPNKLFLDPYGAIAGGALVNPRAIKFCFVAFSK